MGSFFIIVLTLKLKYDIAILAYRNTYAQRNHYIYTGLFSYAPVHHKA